MSWLFCCNPAPLVAQELQAKITINHAQISGTEKSVFDNLQQTLEQFVNDRQWTHLQFQKNERIVCNFNLQVTKYDKDQGIFTCKATIQANRPVYNSAYTSTLYNNSQFTDAGDDSILRAILVHEIVVGAGSYFTGEGSTF